MDIYRLRLLSHAVATIAAGASLAGSCGKASAADPPAVTPAGQHIAKLEEIVVTAEKRATRLQKTPINITAIGAKQLEDRHVEEFEDLGSVIPSVQMIPVSQTVQVSIRGIGSNFFDPRGQTSVSSSIDGLYYARPAQDGSTFFDVSRIEVLNGPQGTLYGTNAAAGAVNLITNKPSDHLEAYIEGSVGNYDMREYAGMINLPVADTLDIRLSGKGLLHNGYVANYYDDAGNNSARASAKWTPTEAFTAYFAYNYAGFSGHGTAPVTYPCDPTPYSNFVSQRCAPPGSSGGYFPTNAVTNTDLETYQLNLDYDLGFAKLTSISGLMTQSITDNNGPNGNFFSVDDHQSSHDWSEEFRIASETDARQAGSFGWVVGAYYSTGNGQNFSSYSVAALGAPTVQPHLPENTEAGFGQATYAVTNAIRATAGIRYTHDYRAVTDISAIPATHVASSFDHINYRLGLEGDVTPSSLAYVTVATGYVAGGADGGNLSLPTLPGFISPIYKPENVLSYEIGSKNTFLTGRLRLNGDFYYYIIKNYQSYDPGLLNTGVEGAQIQNLGNVTTYGGEFSSEFALTADDRFSFAASVAHGSFDKLTINSFGFSPFFTFVPRVITTAPGSQLINLPSYDLRLGYAHDWSLPDGAVLEAGVDSHVSGNYLVLPGSSDPFDRQKSFTMTDLHLRYTGTKGFTKGISVEGWIKNVENAAVNTYSESPGFHLYFPLPPRTFGVTARYSFF